MRWRGRAGSRNVEDRRGMPIGRMGSVGGIGCGGLILLLIVSFLFDVDPTALLEMTESTRAPAPAPSGVPGVPSDELGQFASVVLADTEATWSAIFAAAGHDYGEPVLVLFDQPQVQSGCGFASAAVGPFYCPADFRLYLDLGFFDTLERRLGASGDFAQAYVIAHEVGHHVQNLLGTMSEVDALRRRSSEADANALSVALELQADCFAGVWAHHAHRERALLEPGDLEEGLAAAAAIGDDTLQQQSQGYTVPETWTHGSSEQRVRWLRRGMETGDPASCDTLSGSVG
jgi:predicted metalloprotease